MDPTITALLVTGLGQGLVKALELLADKGVAEVGFEPLKDLMKRGWDERKDKEALEKAVGAALNELSGEGDLEVVDRLFTLPRLAGLKGDQFTLMAAAAVEMARPDPQKIPAGLLAALGLDEKQAACWRASCSCCARSWPARSWKGYSQCHRIRELAGGARAAGRDGGAG